MNTQRRPRTDSRTGSYPEYDEQQTARLLDALGVEEAHITIGQLLRHDGYRRSISGQQFKHLVIFFDKVKEAMTRGGDPPQSVDIAFKCRNGCVQLAECKLDVDRPRDNLTRRDLDGKVDYSRRLLSPYCPDHIRSFSECTPLLFSEKVFNQAERLLRDLYPTRYGKGAKRPPFEVMTVSDFMKIFFEER